MSNLRIVHTNFHDDATSLSVTSEALLATNTQNVARDSVWRSTTIASQTFTGSWGGEDRTPGFFGMFRHRCQGAASTVRLQLYSDAAATAQVYDSGALAVSAAIAHATFRWGLNSTSNEYSDLFYSQQHYGLWFTPQVCKAYKITLGGTCPLTYWEVGRIFLGSYFEPTYNPLYGLGNGWQNNSVRRRSFGGSQRRTVGQLWRKLEMQFDNIPDAERPLWDDVARYVCAGRDVVVSLFPGAGGRAERDYTANGSMTQVDPLVLAGAARQSMRFVLEEN